MERRTFIKSAGMLGLSTLITPTGILQANPLYEEANELEQNFQNPPFSARPHTWWHWMNGNVTKEGITLDLEAMARVGIGGFQNFDAGTGIPKGPIVYLTPEWLELKKHAIREAERLGLEFTMHNCPGWSSSGGPWITPELSMKEVTWSEMVIQGGQEIDVSFPLPFNRLDFYKDVALLAYPSLPGEKVVANTFSKIRTNTAVLKSEDVVGEGSRRIQIKPGNDGQSFLEFQFSVPYDIQQVSFITAAYGENKGSIVLQTSEDGSTFNELATFNTGSFFGEPRGDVSFSKNIPTFKALFLRFVCNHEREFSQVRFSGVPRADQWERRANYSFNRYGTNDITEGLPALDSKTILNVTSYLQPDGRLKWTAPKGQWTIIRFGYTSAGTLNRSAPDTGVGLECDKFSAEAFEFHFNKMMESLLPHLEPLGKKGKAGLLIDSYEVGMQNWTEAFDKQFTDRAGYNILPFLPAMTGRVVDSADTTNRFLWDLRRAQGDLMADNYYGKFTELCHRHNMISYIQPYDRGPMEEMQIGSRIDINVGEFWNNLSSIFQNNWTMRRTVKLSAAIAHTNGQKVVAAESFTGEPESSKWQEHPFALKMIGDRMFAQGLNRMVFHRFAHQPHPSAKPGMTMGAWGSHFDRTNTWWEQGKAWIQYLSRCQYLLQEGTFVADLVYFTGEDAGVYTRVERNELYPSPPDGVDYDLINAEAILKKAKVVGKRLVLQSGSSYAVLALQDFPSMSVPLLLKIKEFVDDGLMVTGKRPRRTPGIDERQENQFNELVKKLWGSDLIQTMTIEEALQRVRISKDFHFTSQSGDAPLVYLHRKFQDSSDVYFVANQRRTFEDVVCTFRVTNKEPEIWDPVKGRSYVAPVYSKDDTTITLPLQMSPSGSLFVIFRKSAKSDPITSISIDSEKLIEANHFDTKRISYPDVSGNFSITLWAKPENSVMLTTDNFMDGQQPWTDLYCIYPSPGENLYGAGHATAGLAVGRNGVAVWENTKGKPYFVLGAAKPISGWTPIALVYRDGVPSLYVNGEHVKSGLKSALIVHPGAGNTYLGEGASYFNGDMSVPVVQDEALAPATIQQIAARSRTHPDARSFVAEDGKFVAFAGGEFHTLTSSGSRSSGKIEKGNAIDLSNNWSVSFPKGQGAPESINLGALRSLHLHEDPGVKYFSGTCIYKKDFTLSRKDLRRGRRFFVDLGEVEAIAEVSVNSKDLGTFWCRPFLIDVSNFLLEGENRLSVSVTNLWPNRLIGDEQSPETCKYSPGGGGRGFASLSGGGILELPEWYKKGLPKPDDSRVAFATWKHYTKDSPLLQSGLIGPVTLMSGQEIPLE